MAADEPDQRHQDKVGKHAAGAQDHRTAQAHHVAESQDEADRVEAEHHARLVVQVTHDGQELEIDEFLPDLEGGDEEVVDAGDGRRLEQEFGLAAALLAGHQHLGDGSRFRIRQHAVHLAHEVAPQRDQEQHAQDAARQADKDRLQRMRVELQDV
jgi:hypothetical protein